MTKEQDQENLEWAVDFMDKYEKHHKSILSPVETFSDNSGTPLPDTPQKLTSEA